jgi:hypothetical protein
LVSNPGKRITPYDIASLFAEAYGKTATIPIAVSGFSSTGIFPFNPDVFTEADFAHSFVTDIEFATEQSSPPEQPIHIAVETVPHSASWPRPDLSPETYSFGVDDNPSDGETIEITTDYGTSIMVPVSQIFTIDTDIASNIENGHSHLPSNSDTFTVSAVSTDNVQTTSTVPAMASRSDLFRSTETSPCCAEASSRISFTQISPLPKVSTSNKASRKRTAQASEIITSSPFKEAAKKKEEERIKPNVSKKRTKKAADATTVVQTDNKKKTARKNILSRTSAAGAAKKAKNSHHRMLILSQSAWFVGRALKLIGSNATYVHVGHMKTAELTHPVYYYCDNCRTYIC